MISTVLTYLLITYAVIIWIPLVIQGVAAILSIPHLIKLGINKLLNVSKAAYDVVGFDTATSIEEFDYTVIRKK